MNDVADYCVIPSDSLRSKSTKPAKKVQVLSVKSNGRVEKHIVQEEESFYCRYNTNKTNYRQTSWVPFFNDTLYGNENVTKLVDDIVQVLVEKLGNEPNIFYPFGYNHVPFKLREGEYSMEINDFDSTRTENTTGRLFINDNNYYTIEYNTPQVSSPYTIKGAFHIE